MILGQLLKKKEETEAAKGKEKKKLLMEIKRINNARLQEDLEITLRRLREDTIYAIKLERNPPLRRLDEKFTGGIVASSKNLEKCLNPVLVPTWMSYKDWARKQGLKLRLVYEKTGDGFFSWYTMYFEKDEKVLKNVDSKKPS